MSKKTSIICTGLAALLCVVGMTQMYRMMATENSAFAEEIDSVNMKEEPQDLTNHCVPNVCELNYHINGDTAEASKMVVIVEYPDELPKEIVVDDTYFDCPVTSIAYRCFHNVDFAESILLPDSIETVEMGAFFGCTALKEIHLPKNLKSIGKGAFLNCESLTDVYYDGTKEQWKAIQIDKNNTVLEKATIHFADGTMAIGHDVTVITPVETQETTETETQDLTSHCVPNICDLNYRVNDDTAEAYEMVVIVEFPKDREELPKEFVVADTFNGYPVTSIASEAFFEADFLESIILPDSVEKIGKYSFECCHKLKEMHFPKNLKTLEEGAFMDCSSLEAIYFSDSLESIGAECFDANDTALTDVYYAGTKEQWEKIAIAGGNVALENATIHFNAVEPTDATEHSYNSNLNNNSLTTQPLTGDVDEDDDVDIIDVLALNQYLLGVHKISDSAKITADVDGNGIINDSDAMNILKYLVRLIPDFESLRA